MAVSRHRGRAHAGDHRRLEPIGDAAKLSGRATRHIRHWHVLMEFRARRCDFTATVIDTGHAADLYGSSGCRRALTTGNIRDGNPIRREDRDDGN
jgi:hypothetical protein